MFRRCLLSIVGSAMCLLCPAVARAANPLLPDYHADPSIHYFPQIEGTNKYWMYVSTDQPNATNWTSMSEWHAYSSSNLLNWEDHGVIFDLSDISWASTRAFAPDVAYANGQYYFYFPAGTITGGGIGVATSSTPGGQFTDALGQPLVKLQNAPWLNQCIDPAVFIDDDGAAYMYFGNGGGGAVVELGSNMTSLAGPIQQLNLPNFAEGPWMHKYDGKYYLTYNATGGSIPNSKLGYSTSTNPTSGFAWQGYFSDNLSRNNHGSVIEVDGQSYLFYHQQSSDPVNGMYRRRVIADLMNYSADGTIQMVSMTSAGIDPLQSANPDPHFLLDFRNDPADTGYVSNGDQVYVNSVARHYTELGVQGLVGDEAVWYMDNGANATRTFQGLTVTTYTTTSGDKYINANSGVYDDDAVLDGYLRSTSNTNMVNTVTLAGLGNLLRPFDEVTLWLFGAGDSANDGTDFQVLYGGSVIGSGYTLYNNTPAISFTFQTGQSVLNDLLIRWSNHVSSYEGAFSGLAITAESLIMNGDCDRNGNVNFSDLGTLISNYNQAGDWAQGDFTGDSVVGFTDLGMLISNYGQSIIPTPEPGSVMLLALAGVAGLRGRRGRKAKCDWID